MKNNNGNILTWALGLIVTGSFLLGGGAYLKAEAAEREVAVNERDIKYMRKTLDEIRADVRYLRDRVERRDRAERKEGF